MPGLERQPQTFPFTAVKLKDPISITILVNQRFLNCTYFCFWAVLGLRLLHRLSAVARGHPAWQRARLHRGDSACWEPQAPAHTASRSRSTWSRGLETSGCRAGSVGCGAWAWSLPRMGIFQGQDYELVSSASAGRFSGLLSHQGSPTREF